MEQVKVNVVSIKMAMSVKFLLSHGFLVREDPVAGHIFKEFFYGHSSGYIGLV